MPLAASSKEVGRRWKTSLQPAEAQPSEALMLSLRPPLPSVMGVSEGIKRSPSQRSGRGPKDEVVMQEERGEFRKDGSALSDADIMGEEENTQKGLGTPQ